MPDRCDEDLLNLIKLWVQYKPFPSVVSAADYSPQKVPSEIAKTLASRDEQLLEDTALWLAFPRADGLGLRYLLSEYKIYRNAEGQEEISPFVCRVQWATSMATHSPGYEEHKYKLSKLVRDGDAWKVAAVCDESEREEMKMILHLVHS